MKKVLTIAGSDSGGGAGIQADLKTFAALGVFGMSALTAVTAQNTRGVQGVHAIPSSFVASQIDSVMVDIGADVWKTGMLANAKIVAIIAQRARHYKVKKLVLDPVMFAATGRRLLAKSAQEVLKKELLPLALVATPNVNEAEALSGIRIISLSDMKKAALVIHKMGVKNVVIKGGHLPLPCHAELVSASRSPSKEIPKQVRDDKERDAIDILFDGKTFREFKKPWIKTRNTHGTGCTFASAIAAEIAKGKSVVRAVGIAKRYVAEALQKSANFRIGQGNGPLTGNS